MTPEDNEAQITRNLIFICVALLLIVAQAIWTGYQEERIADLERTSAALGQFSADMHAPCRNGVPVLMPSGNATVVCQP